MFLRAKLFQNGDTALHIASAMGRKKLVRILLESGHSDWINSLNLQRETARDIATRKKYDDITAMLDDPPKAEAIPRASGGDETDSKDDRKSRRKARVNDRQVFFSGKMQLIFFSLQIRRSGRKRETSANFSPYGCHYYPDLEEFPAPDLGSLPKDPLSPGEQYFLDLAGNIKKGPKSNRYTCYCAPLFHRFEQRLDKNKRDVVRHLETTHGRLEHRISSLERKTRDQISGLSNSMKETIAQERVECQDRMDRRSIRDRMAIDRHQAMRNAALRDDVSAWFEDNLRSLEENRSKSQVENLTLVRTMLRGSKRKKRAILSQIQSGNIRRALSEDELDQEDAESMSDKRLKVDEDEEDDAGLADRLESLTVQSEMDFKPRRFVVTERGLRVADQPTGGDHVYQNAADVNGAAAAMPTEVYHGKSQEIYRDFGDFKTQELDALTDDEVKGSYRPDLHRLSAFGSEFRHLDGGAGSLSYSTHSESQAGSEPVLPRRPVPLLPEPPVTGHETPPMLPPKRPCPPPYRSPPASAPSPPQTRPFAMPPIEEDVYMSQEPLSISSTTIAPSFNSPPPLFSLPTPHLTAGASSSDGGGSHDSHNDSGYCMSAGRFGSGGPSPSLSGGSISFKTKEDVRLMSSFVAGSQSRPDSRGCPDEYGSKPQFKAPLLVNGNAGVGGIVAPRIKQLQLSLARNANQKQDFCPKGSLV